MNLLFLAVSRNVVAITAKEFSTLAKRSAQSQLNSNKLTTNFGFESSDCMLGIRSSLTAIGIKKPLEK